MEAAYSVISEFKNRCSNADGGKEPEALYAGESNLSFPQL
jgi:hypothetical protein